MASLSLTDDREFVMIAGIDFGTTYSGYAFSFKAKPDDVSMNKNWGEAQGLGSYKTPTSVLTCRGQFVAFGHEAEEKYSQVIEDASNIGDYQIYRHFKMLLHKDKDVSRKSTVTSVGGVVSPAMDIFVMAIRYLKDHLIESLSKQLESPLSPHDIKWVITVPAIWTEEAKQFMREAAYKADCIAHKNSKWLVTALEPEAASLFCKGLNLDGFAVAGDTSHLAFKTNTKYLVVDAGGGTVDITAHKIKNVMGEIEELLVASGGPWGGTQVDQNFSNLLKDILGADFLNYFKKKFPVQWMKMCLDFEKAKKGINPNDTLSKIVMPLSWSMGTEFSSQSGKNVETVINTSKGVSFHNGNFVIDHNACLALFSKIVNMISEHIKELIGNPMLQGLSYVLLVGGFGECVVLQEAVRSVLPPNVKLFVPQEAQLSVIKGAIKFGYNTNAIQSRIARKTYGVEIMEEFQLYKHNPDKKRQKAAGDRCADVFQKFVTKGDSVNVGTSVVRSYVPLENNQKSMSFQVYSSNKDKLDTVEYVDNPHFSKVGSGNIIVEMPNTEKNLDRVVKVEFLLGGTEIQLKAHDLESGCTAETIIDFLAG